MSAASQQLKQTRAKCSNKGGSISGYLIKTGLTPSPKVHFETNNSRNPISATSLPNYVMSTRLKKVLKEYCSRT